MMINLTLIYKNIKMTAIKMRGLDQDMMKHADNTELKNQTLFLKRRVLNKCH
jgi:hypothetical protein